MARQRSHSIEFKRQVAQEFIAGETLYALAKRHDDAFDPKRTSAILICCDAQSGSRWYGVVLGL